MEMPKTLSLKILLCLMFIACLMQTAHGLISCPDQCTCTKGTVSTNTLEVSCTDRHLPELPHSLPFATSYRLLFAHNDITVLDSRAYLDRTVYLDLSHNQINNLTNEAMKELVGRVRYLHLHNNNLTCLPLAMDTTEVVTSVNEITLHDNPWNCSCLEMILHKWIKDDHRQVFDTNSLRCYDQPELPMRSAHQDGVHNRETEETPKDHQTENIKAEGDSKLLCELGLIKESSLIKRQGFLAFLMTIVSLVVIFAGLGVLYGYKHVLKQREKERRRIEDTDDTKAMITHI